MTPENITTSARLAGLVQRYHTWPVLRHQTVAEHSWQVARIYTEIFGTPSAEVAAYIQLHDAGEIVTGDLPYPVKTQHPDVRAIVGDMEYDAVVGMGHAHACITDIEKKRVKICDLLEMLEYAREEMARGNKFAQPVYDRLLKPIREKWLEITDDLNPLLKHMRGIMTWST